ncbi:GntR family transcriptional regulator [Pikeienuella piscinae]|uniref:GntR family transcriptional regulator n=1 Tax=Pikeienuella piscinae TaxID=2748098 RepID=A0A7M3T730_9RHOB|nr:GntR family transcriptional regulator [Pikeienuella piscinae]
MDQVVDAIVEATATGVFLPGDRIVEAEIARSLNVSRVPVREALRILESQGIVVNTRYRGMRLMDVGVERLEKILKVRLALETLAAREVLEKMRDDPDLLRPLEKVVADLHAAARRKDAYEVARLDAEFHRVLCDISGNEILLQLWEPLSRQLTIIFGLSTFQKELASIVSEHDSLLESLTEGDMNATEKAMKVHILDYTQAIDYEGFVERLRQLETRSPD